MSLLKYQDATINDLPKIVAIYNSTITSRMVTADTEPVTIESKMEWFSKHSPQKRPLWIIENENSQTIGWVSFQSFYGRPAYESTVELSIYLDEFERGKGYGKQILKHCLDVAPAFGIKTLLGFIFAHNKSSLNLFYHAGFEDWGTLPNVALLDSIERTLKIVGKRVN